MEYFALRLVFAANVLVAGWISITSVFSPQKAVASIFENAIAYSEAIRLVGCLWGAIFLLSIIGLFRPKEMALVLLFQLIYKSSYLLFVAWPAARGEIDYPRGMTITFLLWVVILPFVIPWRSIF